jgi:hypothetical protein
MCPHRFLPSTETTRHPVSYDDLRSDRGYQNSEGAVIGVAQTSSCKTTPPPPPIANEADAAACPHVRPQVRLQMIRPQVLWLMRYVWCLGCKSADRGSGRSSFFRLVLGALIFDDVAPSPPVLNRLIRGADLSWTLFLCSSRGSG